MVCPICKQQLSENVVFCPQCGFELHILPNSVSDKVRKYEKEREDKFKERYFEKDKCERKLLDIQNRNAQLLNELSSKNCEITRLSNENNKVGLENSRLKAEMIENDARSKKNIAELENKINSVKEDLIREQNLRKITKEKADIKGIVLIESLKYKIRTMLPIYDGINTYGSTESNGSHHKISLLVRGYEFKPKHFSIENSAKGMILTGLDGVSIKHNGIETDSKKYVRQTDECIMDDIILINITKY